MKVIIINKTVHTQDEFKDKVRDVILEALDSVSPTGKGWIDSDLTELFKSVDNHSDKLFDRLGVIITPGISAEMQQSKIKQMTTKQLKSQGFICTDPDTNQWVKQINTTEFEVFEQGELNTIDLDDYSDQDLEREIMSYYKSLEVLRSMYGGHSNRIIAEIIAENNYK